MRDPRLTALWVLWATGVAVGVLLTLSAGCSEPSPPKPKPAPVEATDHHHEHDVNEPVRTPVAVPHHCRPDDTAHLVRLLPVSFDFDEDQPNDRGTAALLHNGRCLRSLLPDSLVLVGHADERGPRRYNTDLGFRRAQSVYQWMRERQLWGANWVVTSEGEDSPLCQASTERCWERNRRVEFEAP